MRTRQGLHPNGPSQYRSEGSGMVAKIDQVRRGEVRTAHGHDSSERLDSEKKDAPDRHGEDGASQGI